MPSIFMLKVAALAALCLASPATAQEPAAPEAPADIVQIENDPAARMTVPVSIGGNGPHRFVVDTGAERTVISSELAGQLGLDAAGHATIHSMSGPGRVKMVTIPRLDLSNGTMRGIRAPAIQRADLGAAGMLGIDSLQEQRIILDFKAATMTILPSKKTRQTRREKDEIVVVAQNRYGRLVLVDASFEGKRIHVIIDTGAQTSVGNEALRKLVMRKGGKIGMPVELTSVLGGKTPATYTAIPVIRIGGVDMQHLPVAFAEVYPFTQLGLTKKPALLLGMNGLKLFDRVSVDFANKKVRFLLPGAAGRDDGTMIAAENGQALQAGG